MTADTPSRASRKLLALILVELDVDLDPTTLRRFIQGNWSKIAPLAHIIHGETDTTKPPPGGTGAGK